MHRTFFETYRNLASELRRALHPGHARAPGEVWRYRESRGVYPDHVNIDRARNLLRYCERRGLRIGAFV